MFTISRAATQRGPQLNFMLTIVTFYLKPGGFLLGAPSSLPTEAFLATIAF
ncbi:MAG: hypothetical protein ACJ718_04805 [Nitrososphaeraceae archaeon]